MRRTFVSLTVLLVTAAFVRAAPQLQPIGLTIGSPMLEEMDFSFRPGNLNPGVSVQVLVTGVEQTIVKLDEDACGLDKAVDSTGKDLLTEPPKQDTGGFQMSMNAGPIGPFPRISEDGSALIVELIVPQTPASDAVSIHYEGNLALLVAEGRKTISANGVALQPGKVQLDDHTLEITEVGASDWEEGKFKLTIKLSEALHGQIAEWKVTDAAGNALTDGPYSTMTMMNTVELEMSLEQKPDTVNIALELYDGLEQVIVPVKLKVGLGIR